MKNILASCRLYGIVDMGYTKPDQVEARTHALIDGGVRIIQLRAKGVGLAQVKVWAIAMQAICRDRGAIFVLNDYPEMAAEIGADCVLLSSGHENPTKLKNTISESFLTAYLTIQATTADTLINTATMTALVRISQRNRHIIHGSDLWISLRFPNHGGE